MSEGSVSSYYDDPDFADEYQRRDEDALEWAASEREREIELNSEPREPAMTTTATINLNPTTDHADAFPYIWTVTDAAGEELDAGNCDVASEDETEWAQQADELLTAQGWKRTAGWATSGEQVTASVERL